MSTEGTFETDLSRWPLVVWRMNRVLTVPEFQVYLRDVEQVLARRERFAEIVVSQLGSGKSALTGDTRKMQAEWIKAHFKELEKYCAAMAVVLTDISPVAHFTASFFMAIIGRSPSASKICTSEAEAVAWVQQRLLARTG